MSDFDTAVKVILKHEGGLANNPNDPGGITNFGISIMFVTKILASQGVTLSFPIPNTPDLIKALTVDQAKEIYQKCWWDFFGYSRIEDQTLATKVFDMAVNMGPPDQHSAKSGRAHKIVQESLNKLGRSEIVVDGQLGNKSYTAINSIQSSVLLPVICAGQGSFYEGLIAANPRLAVFRSNWYHRSMWPFGISTK
jgi:lysozyme family protein